MSATNARRLASLLDELAAGADPAAAQLAALSDLGGEDAALLREEWPRLSLDARRAIITRARDLAEEFVDLDFTQLARVALHDPDPTTRLAGVEALWESVDRHAAGDLVALLREDPAEEVRAAAAARLRQFVLLREFDDIDEEEGDRVVDGLRDAAEDAAEAVDVRARALESLGPRTLPWVDTLITEAYYDEDPDLRLAALNAMGGSAQERWLDYLFEELQSGEPAFRAEAAIACGCIASEDAVGPLVDALDDAETEVVLAVVQALGEIGGPEALRQLRSFRERTPPALEDAVAAAIEAAQFFAEISGDDDEDR
jgi:HEAT repeat protein